MIYTYPYIIYDSLLPTPFLTRSAFDLGFSELHPTHLISSSIATGHEMVAKALILTRLMGWAPESLLKDCEEKAP